MYRKLILIYFLQFSASVFAGTFSSNVGLCSYTINFQGDIANGNASVLNRIIDNLNSNESKNWKDCGDSIRKTIILNSKGGDLDESIIMGRIIRKNQMEVIVPGGSGECLSACVYMLSGGVERVILGSVGVHRSYFVALNSDVSIGGIRARRDNISKKVRDYLNEMDISLSLIDYIESTPPESIRILSDGDLRLFRLDGLDSAYEEKKTAEKARKYNLTSAEFRRRDIKSRDLCAKYISPQATGASYKECEWLNLLNLDTATLANRLVRFRGCMSSVKYHKDIAACEKKHIINGE